MKVIWCKTILVEQGVCLNQNILSQNNMSAELLEKKGISSCGKILRVINILYLAIKDYHECGELQIHHCPSDDIVRNFVNNPLQGEKFKYFRKLILGL